MKNKYAHRSRVSEAKIREVIRYFVADLTALQSAQLSGLNRNTVNRFYRALPERILWACEAQRPMFGIVEVDESFFGARRVKGKRGRGAYGKTVVFGVFERDGQVYTEIGECHKLCVSGLAHAGFRYGHALKRSSNMIANWLRAANHWRTFLPPFSKFRMAR